MTTPITYEASPSDLVREAEIAERDRIVAWLRAKAEAINSRSASSDASEAWAEGWREALEDAASGIEATEHLGPDEFVRVQRGSLDHDPKEWR